MAKNIVNIKLLLPEDDKVLSRKFNEALELLKKDKDAEIKSIALKQLEILKDENQLQALA